MNKNTTNNKAWVYDCEVYSNFFCVTFKNPKSQEVKIFTIFEDTNDIDELYRFIDNHTAWFIGYNSFNFDNQLLKYIHQKHSALTFASTIEITFNISNLARLIINNDFKEYMYNLPFKSIDLMKIGRYQKSLKLLGVSLKWHKLQDLPIPPETILTKEQADTIIKYNLNDVEITEKLYYHLLDAIKFRHEISKIYGINVYGEPDTGIANRLLEKFYSESTGIPIRDFKNLRTNRKFIKFDQVIFDNIIFQTNTMDIMLEQIYDHIYYEGQPFFHKKIKFDNMTYKLGVGGIHSVDTGEIFEETDDTFVIDADIGSMYPATVINHQLYPNHLGPNFLKKYQEIRDDRIKNKIKKNITISEGLKLILNSAIGKTRSKYSFLYDPLVNLQVTINGQLYLLMLIEKLVLNKFKVVSANTDGITTLVDKNRVDEYYKLCKQWEDQTEYNLEYIYYKKYIRRDVNNYIAIKQDGSVKTKGVFINKPAAQFNNSTDPLNKGWDKPIVSIALYEYFVNNTPIKDTIRNHRDIYDFCIAKKIDSKFKNEYHHIQNKEYKVDILQKSVRYYVSTNGGSLIKKNDKDGVIINYEQSKNVTIFNDYKEENNFDNYKINYPYYIHATQKIINEIINQQLTLF